MNWFDRFCYWLIIAMAAIGLTIMTAVIVLFMMVYMACLLIVQVAQDLWRSLK